jgi:hypothetical protein
MEAKKMDQNLEKRSSQDKLQLDIFVPLNTCSCMYEHFINRVFEVVMEFMQLIEFKTKSLDSEEAHELNLHENCVVLDKTKVILEPYKLKDEITHRLKARGLVKK